MTQRVAHRSRSRIASKSAAPFGDRRYSTATGRSRWTFRSAIPTSSSSFNVFVSELWHMPVATRSSLKRFGPERRLWRTVSLSSEPITSKATIAPQPGPSQGLSFSAMTSHPCTISCAPGLYVVSFPYHVSSENLVRLENGLSAGGSDPPGDDDLALREEPDRVAALWMEVPEERVLHPAEREVGHRGGDSDVDADVPRVDAVPEVPGVLPARRVDRRGVPVRARVHHVDCLLQGVDRQEVRDGPEDLLSGDAHVRPDVIEDRRADEVTVITGHLDGASVQGDLGAFLLPSIDEVHHPVAVGLGNHRAHLDRLVQAVPDPQRGGGTREGVTKLLVHVAHANDDGTGEATLSRATVAGGDHVRDDLVEFCVPHDHEDVLRAASGLDALPRGGGFCVDLRRDSARADERDAGDVRVIEDCG